MIKIHHISLKTPPLDINKAIDCFPSIRSLISSYPYDHHLGSNNVRNIGFLKSNSLRVLELNVQLIEKTIFTPKKMKYLRYMELSIREITIMPEEISTLYLLQTLRLSKCWNLEKLPEGMRYMSNLRHLYVSKHCYNLRSMPKGLGQLKCLQILTTYIVGTDAGNDIRELNTLNNLHGQLHLYNLRKIKHVVDAREANLIAKQNLDDLSLCWGMPIDCQGFDHNIPESNDPEVIHCDPFEVFDALKPHNGLKVLKVTLYRGYQLPTWMTEYHMLENLIELYIIKCRECTEIPPVEMLPLLRILKLKHLDNLRHLYSNGADFDEDTRIVFPSLQKMVLYEMPNLSSWCEGEEGNKPSLIFPVLKRLKITNCPKLTTMPITPSLIFFR
ncbi:putative disease resistance protein At3g14460 [Carex rostrata]